MPTHNPFPSGPWKRTTLLFLGHFLNDGFASFYAPLLPLLIDRLDLSLVLAGLLGTVRIVVNSLMQPGLGHLADRAQRPVLVVLGPVLTVAAMCFIGRAGSFEQLLLIMIVAGIGTAFFHPTAAALVGSVHHRSRGLMMALFSAGGTLGAAVSPLVIVAYAEKLGLERTPWLILPGILVLLAFALPLRKHLPAVDLKSTERIRFRQIPKRLVILWFVVVLRAIAATSFSNFLAVLVIERGGSALLGGAAISLFLLLGAAGGLAAGSLSDRIGRKAILLGSLALATPCLVAFLYGPLNLLLPLIAVSGLFVLSSTPVGVVAAQECLPGRTGLVSGLVMGLAWGVGGLALVPIGWLADRFGLISVMTIVSLLPLAAAALMFLYHEPRSGNDNAEEPSASIGLESVSVRSGTS
ncbi:MFS transporter [Candidatus Bipolaricaulota bacterium]|nr:MFS transporter [Candidatus Bipolaricaulota bacterium]